MNAIMVAGLGDAIKNVAQYCFFTQKEIAQEYCEAFSRVLDSADNAIIACQSQVTNNQFEVTFKVMKNEIPSFSHFLNEYLCGYFAPTTISCNYNAGLVIWRASLDRARYSLAFPPSFYEPRRYR